MREVLRVEFDNMLLHGTFHPGRDNATTGVVFLNSGAQPRCSRGDLNAHLADSLAGMGFPCFRVDLPGLGDSDGNLPVRFSEFYQLVEAGAFAGCTRRISEILSERHDLKRVLLFGICGGAMASIFAATRGDPKGPVAGLILLDVPFTSVTVRTTPSQSQTQANPNSVGQRLRSSARRFKGGLHDWVLARSWEPYATALYHNMTRVWLYAKRGKIPMPANTNQKVLGALSVLLERQLPALFLTAHPTESEPATFDFMDYLRRHTGRPLEHVRIQGTTHSFVENGGAEAVLKAVSSWIKRLEDSFIDPAEGGTLTAHCEQVGVLSS